MYNLRAESDGVIFKPRPKKDNTFIHVDWESCPVPKATTIYVKKSFRKTSKPTTVTCAKHTTKSDTDPCAEHLEPFLRSKFHMKADTTLSIQSEEQYSTLSSDSIMEPEPECVAISKGLILLPFSYTQLDRNRKFLEPVHETRKLIEDYNEYARCKHGNPFMSGGPRDSWLVERNRTKNATILVTTYKTEYVNVYFRPTVGNQCDCRQLYDGNKDGIIYARENYLVTCAFIMGILTSLQYQTCSVYAYVTSINLNRNLNYNAYTVSHQWIQEAYTAFVKLAKPRDGIELF